MKQASGLAPEPVLTTCHCPGHVKTPGPSPNSPLHSVLCALFPLGLLCSPSTLEWEKCVH